MGPFETLPGTVSGALLSAVVAVILTGAALSGQTGPPVPYEDAGACPFEGCVYREWIARRLTPVFKNRDRSSPILFYLTREDQVQAITGIVVTTKLGVVRFTQAWRGLALPGELLYLLTYRGEGHTKAWFKGQFFESLDASDFLNGACETAPSTCPAEVLERPTHIWWVQVRNASGHLGWTDRPQDFANKDALGATFEEESAEAGLADPR